MIGCRHKYPTLESADPAYCICGDFIQCETTTWDATVQVNKTYPVDPTHLLQERDSPWGQPSFATVFYAQITISLEQQYSFDLRVKILSLSPWLAIFIIGFLFVHPSVDPPLFLSLSNVSNSQNAFIASVIPGQIFLGTYALHCTPWIWTFVKQLDSDLLLVFFDSLLTFVILSFFVA